MKALTAEERQTIIEHTKRIAATMKTHHKGRYDFKAKQPNFSSFALSAVEDDGATDGVYDDDFLLPERRESALMDIKRHLIRADIAETTGNYIKRQNSIRERNRQRVADTRKAFDNR